jgi:hypothetical protein
MKNRWRPGATGLSVFPLDTCGAPHRPQGLWVLCVKPFNVRIWFRNVAAGKPDSTISARTGGGDEDYPKIRCCLRFTAWDITTAQPSMGFGLRPPPCSSSAQRQRMVEVGTLFKTAIGGDA